MAGDRTLMVLGVPWTVRVKDIPEWAQADGYNDDDSHLIVVDKKKVDDDTLLHEVVHVLVGALGMDLPERDTRNLATVLFAVIRDNEWFADWLADSA